MTKGIDLLQEVIQERLEEKRREEAMSHLQYCPKCKTDKPADTDHFYNDSKSKTGLSCWCKDCQRAASAKREEKKRASGEAKQKAAKIEKKPVTLRSDPKKKMVLTLDFSKCEMWFADLKQEAADKLRTPEMQAMWLISKALYQERDLTDNLEVTRERN